MPAGRRPPAPRRGTATPETSEANDEPARELELVRVLRVPYDVASAQGVAPEAFGIRLDVGRRPAGPQAQARAAAREELEPRGEGRGELRLPTDLASLAVEPGKLDPSVVGRPRPEAKVRPGVRGGIPEVVGEDAVIVVEVQIPDLHGRRSADFELGRLAVPEKVELPVRRQQEAKAEAIRERVLGLEAIIEVAVGRHDPVAGDSVA